MIPEYTWESLIVETHPEHPNTVKDLSPRDIKILTLLAEGFTARKIGRRIGAAESTVRNTLSTRIYPTLEVNGAFEAIALCLESNVINPGQLVPDDYESRLANLTAKEKEVLDVAIVNRSRDGGEAVGKTVFISTNTVDTHLTRIRRKLNANNSVHAQSMHLASVLKKQAKK